MRTPPTPTTAVMTRSEYQSIPQSVPTPLPSSVYGGYETPLPSSVYGGFDKHSHVPPALDIHRFESQGLSPSLTTPIPGSVYGGYETPLPTSVSGGFDKSPQVPSSVRDKVDRSSIASGFVSHQDRRASALGEDDNTAMFIFDSYRYSRLSEASQERPESFVRNSANFRSSLSPVDLPTSNQKSTLRIPRLSDVPEPSDEPSESPSAESPLGESVGLFMLQVSSPLPTTPKAAVAPIPSSPGGRNETNVASALRRQAEANREPTSSPMGASRAPAAASFPSPPHLTFAGGLRHNRPRPTPLRQDSLHTLLHGGNVSTSPRSPRLRANTSPDAEVLKGVAAWPEAGTLRPDSQNQLSPPLPSPYSHISFDSSSRSSLDDPTQTPRRKTSLRQRAAQAIRRQASLSERPDNLSKQSLVSSSSELNLPLSPGISASPTASILSSNSKSSYLAPLGGNGRVGGQSPLPPESSSAGIVQLGNNEFELVRPNVDYATDGEGVGGNDDESVGGETETEDEGSGSNGGMLVVRPGSAARKRARLTFIADSGGLEVDEVDEHGFLVSGGGGSQDGATPRNLRSEPSPVNVEVHRAKEARWLSILSGGNAGNVRKRKKFKRLVRSGVPSGLRGKVWVSTSDRTRIR
jgi:hypothetical protein